jgi:drug/metabolite transporter (DMT)-like permease
VTAISIPTGRSTFLRGAALALAAAFFWSLAGAVVRQIDLPVIETSFWRSVFMLAAVLPLLLVRPAQLGRELATGGGALLLSGLLLAITFVAFIVAIGMTTVANVLFVMAVGPFITALMARAFLGEPLRATTLAAAALAAGGISLTLVDSVRFGQALGLLLAFLVPVAFAANTVLMRHRRSLPTLPGLAAAALISGLAVLPFVRLGALEMHHIGWLLLLGPVQLALGLFCFTRALRYLPATQAALIALVEMVMGPLWVWLAHGERPGGLALAGGAVVLTAVLLNGVAEMRRSGMA